MQRFKYLRNRFGGLMLGLSGCLAAHAMASGVAFDISAGAARTTLKQFAKEAHIQLLFDYKAVEHLSTPAVKGKLEPTEALKQLLTGSGLVVREINDRTLAVVSADSGAYTQSLP